MANVQLLTAGDVAARLKISRSAAYRLINQLPGRVYIGACLRLSEAALEAYLTGGGDEWLGNEKRTSTFEAEPGGAGSATTTASKSGRAPTKRMNHWLEQLRSGSKTSSSRRRPNTSE
ncbi:MAG: hypothetical protein RLZZ450_5573 [Pseudomonadota bacterium]|jgi:predicted DNA-binding transcriptional regulator AlpA